MANQYQCLISIVVVLSMLYLFRSRIGCRSRAPVSTPPFYPYPFPYPYIRHAPTR